jgi:3-polyprenyl-4-hydroxybenzoate decarboxylase
MFKESRMLIVFNSEVDVQNPSTAYWRAINLVRANRDVVLDGDRIGIDATNKDSRQALSADSAITELIARRWAEYGFCQ